ncbi:hypothetical protein [Streptomyces melanogenes]|uniref:hypothetical protein n=1 Tax=Streptomyces melanogenes TaxID=67326 RepID=UPI0037A36706
MNRMQLPSGHQFFEWDTPEAFKSLVLGDGLELATASWWESLIAACNSCFVAALSDREQLYEWGEAMLAVLAAAWRSDSVAVAEVLKRRMVAKAALFEVLGAEFGDADVICSELLRDLAEIEFSPSAVGGEIAQIEAGARPPDSRMAQLQSLRQTLREASRIRMLVTDERIGSDLDSWCRAVKVDVSPG